MEMTIEKEGKIYECLLRPDLAHEREERTEVQVPTITHVVDYITSKSFITLLHTWYMK